MIEELLHWPVRNRNLLRLGRQVEEINKEFQKLDDSISMGVPNISRARSLNNKIQDRFNRAKKLRPGLHFEQLVLRNHIDSLWCQSEYLKFFFFKNYNEDYGVRQLVNYTFYPESEWSDTNGAVSYIEKLLRNINYHGITKREDLMWEVERFQIPGHYEHIKRRIIEEVFKVKKILRDFNEDKGFITEKQKKLLEIFEDKKEFDRTLQKFKELYGPHLEDDYDKLVLLLKNSAQYIIDKDIELDEDTKALVIDVNTNDEEYACWDPNTNLMELNNDRFRFYLDKKSGKIRFYAGDLYPTVWHENIHRLQKNFSRYMPPGLRQTDGELNLAARTTEEGVAMISEDFFMDYMENNKRRLGVSNKDIERAKAEDYIYMANKIIKFCHAMYHRESDVESEIGRRETDYDVHMRLAEKSGNWALADQNYLYDETFSDSFEELFYIFGRKYVGETMQTLERIETKKFGNKRKARAFIKKNENIVMQGLMTGSWSWSTHGEFFLKHYWPKARRYCEK
ncbi:hypothetical protein KY312_04435 [Candidatus Woesearchaeota archaeon]|nr:hypothetical protein [Candidatus Woesearchaeota archaeon]